MLSSAPDRSLRARIDALCLRLQDHLLAEAADRAEWSYGRRIDCRPAVAGVDSTRLAVLARDFVLRDAPCAEGALAVDGVLARVVAAWEPGGAAAPGKKVVA